MRAAAFGYPLRFMRVWCRHGTGFDIAESTVPGADGTQNQKGCRAGGKTLELVGALGLLANRMELSLVNQGAHLLVFGP
jgi:hypothetical protein